MDIEKGIITLLRRGLACILFTCGLLASPLASAGIIAVAEADVTITLAAATFNGDNVGLTGLDLSLTFSSVETQTTTGQASGSAQATSTLSVANPNSLAIGDSLRVVSSASGNAQNGGSFVFESDGDWVLSITNNSGTERSLLLRFDLVYAVTTDFLADNPQPAGSGGTGGTGGIGVGGIGVGGSVGTGGGGTTTSTGSSSEFDVVSASGSLAEQNLSGTGTIGSTSDHNVRDGTVGSLGLPTDIDPGSRQVFFSVSGLAANSTTVFRSEPVFVRVSGTAAVNAIPETPTLLLLMCGMPVLLLRRFRYKA
jgi:hypothetical protein